MSCVCVCAHVFTKLCGPGNNSNLYQEQYDELGNSLPGTLTVEDSCIPRISRKHLLLIRLVFLSNHRNLKIKSKKLTRVLNSIIQKKWGFPYNRENHLCIATQLIEIIVFFFLFLNFIFGAL